MAKAVSIGEAKANFSDLVRRAEAEEEIVLRRGNHRVARIVPRPEQHRVRGFGALKMRSGSARISIGRSSTSPSTNSQRVGRLTRVAPSLFAGARPRITYSL